ncbi:MAG TPA: hypothetical protein GX707_10325 [Epulopiscium sp.]|nr:hypothetical protein [Candidatus Epulonipiscium sp.]
MTLEFITYQLKEETGEYERIVKGGKYGTGTNEDNQFIIVGSHGKRVYVHQVVDERIALIPGLDIITQAYLIPRKSLELYGEGCGTTISEFDIDLKYLTLETVAAIKTINKN